MLLACMLIGILPFGPHNLALSDGRTYVAGLVGTSRMFHSIPKLGNFLYSLGGMGGNAWSGWAWGGFHPLKLLCAFVNIDNAPEMVTWITLCYLSCCGLTMYILLAGMRGHDLSNLIFSTSYALMGFNVAYCHEHLFFIGPHMLPLVVLGIIWIMRGRSPWLYLFSLFSCILMNCYFGFILCVASVIVFFAYCYAEWESVRPRFRRVFGIYAAASVISGLLAAFMWLPAIKAYSGGDGRLDKLSSSDFSLVENMPFVQLFSKLFAGSVSVEEIITGLPNIFCGIFVVALVILYFMNKEVTSRRKRACGVILGFYLISFFFPPLTIAMQAKSLPNGFPYRYSFVFSFFMICIAAEEYRFLAKWNASDFRRLFAILCIGAAVVFSVEYEYMSGVNALFDLCLLALMIGAVWLFHRMPTQITRQGLSGILLLLVSFNLFSNFALCVKSQQSAEMNVAEYRDNTLLIGSMIDAIKTIDPGCYRMEKDFTQTGDTGTDAGLYGYIGINNFSPAVRTHIRRNLSRLGLNWSGVINWYTNSVPAAADTLFGLKYLISERDLAEEKGYEKLVEIPRFSAFRNNESLSFAFLANEECQSVILGDDAFDNLNRVWKSITGGDEDIFIEQPYISFSFEKMQGWSTTSDDLRQMTFEKVEETGNTRSVIGNIHYSFVAPADGPVYLINMGVPKSSDGQNNGAILCGGVYNKGDIVTGQFSMIDETSTDEMLEFCSNIAVATAKNDVMKGYAETVNARETSFNVIANNHLTGDFSAEKGQVLLFTLPWDEGWTCYIDGQKAHIDITWDLFMSVEVPEGHHTYEMKFFPAWMDYGLVISGLAFVGLIVLIIVWRRNNRKVPTPAIMRSEEGTNSEEH